MANTFESLAALIGLPVKVQLVGKQANVPGDLLDTPGALWELITAHETGNPAVGANAQMHRDFVANGGGANTVSYTFTADDKGVIQILPINQAQYAQGTTRGNQISLSCEMCTNADGNFVNTKENFAKLVAVLTVLAGRTSARGLVVQHNYWYGKDCPMTIRHAGGSWEALLERCNFWTAKLLSIINQPEPATTSIVINGFTVQFGFLELWQKYGLEVMGLPLSNEYSQVEPALDGKSVTYQDYENVQVQWYEGISPRICAAVRRLKYGN